MPARLTEHGLAPCGSWTRGQYASAAHLRDRCPFGLAFTLPVDWKARRDVVYAFVVNGANRLDHAVLYIGETSAGMGKRFADYRYGNQLVDDTDNRIKLAITQQLVQGQAVSIWACQPVASLPLPSGQVLQVPASKPLEEHLISLIQPRLNVKMLATSAISPTAPTVPVRCHAPNLQRP
jgi:hypothetical protein